MQRGEQAGQLLGLVGAVGVHLDEDVVPALQAPGERADVGDTEPRLGPAVQDVHARVAGGELVRQLARAVRALVVDDQDVGLGNGGAQPAERAGRFFRSL